MKNNEEIGSEKNFVRSGDVSVLVCNLLCVLCKCVPISF